MDCPFKPGDKVRVKREVFHPRFGWGGVIRESVGTVSGRRGYLAVDFPGFPGWVADWSEMELVPPIYGNEED